MAIKIVVADPKQGKAKQFEVGDDLAKELEGKRLGQVITGKQVGLDEDYEFTITGGTDNAGFAMRKDIATPGRQKIFAVHGVGLKKTRHGMRKRKTVAGGVISGQTAQINVKITTYGKTPIIAPPQQEAEPQADASAPAKEEESAPETKTEE